MEQKPPGLFLVKKDTTEVRLAKIAEIKQEIKRLAKEINFIQDQLNVVQFKLESELEKLKEMEQ
jgi:hypothetical protein